MKALSTVLLSTCLFAGNAHAALFNFTGDIEYHNDVVFIGFTLDQDANNVRVWTDSFESGTNFDPITALWTGAGALLAENDDNQSINPDTQTVYDSGFAIDFLEAGDYIFSVATYNNFASGITLSDGFQFDNEAPILLADWNQPANGPAMGSFWSVWLDGVDSAVDPNHSVPAPAPLALLGLAIAGFAAARRK